MLKCPLTFANFLCAFQCVLLFHSKIVIKSATKLKEFYLRVSTGSKECFRDTSKDPFYVNADSPHISHQCETQLRKRTIPKEVGKANFPVFFKFHEMENKYINPATFFLKSELGVCLYICQSFLFVFPKQSAPSSAVYAAVKKLDCCDNCAVVDIHTITLTAIKSPIMRAAAGPE